MVPDVTSWEVSWSRSIVDWPGRIGWPLEVVMQTGARWCFVVVAMGLLPPHRRRRHSRRRLRSADDRRRPANNLTVVDVAGRYGPAWRLSIGEHELSRTLGPRHDLRHHL